MTPETLMNHWKDTEQLRPCVGNYPHHYPLKRKMKVWLKLFDQDDIIIDHVLIVDFEVADNKPLYFTEKGWLDQTKYEIVGTVDDLIEGIFK